MSGEPRDVLIVDDEPVIAQGAAKICAAEGLTVDAAENGAEGLRRLAERPYRLAVCDIMMPDVDGFKLLAEASRRGVPTPVVMTTGYSTVENAIGSLDRGAIDFLAKPFTADEFLAVVRRGLRYAQLRAKAARSPGELVHVPCPPKDRRLGYVSWARLEDEGTVLTGVTDLFVKSIDGARRIDLPAAEADLEQGGAGAVIAGADGLEHRIMCPVGGRVLEINGAAAADPSVVEKDPYFEGWLYRVLPSELESDLKRLTPCSSDRI